MLALTHSALRRAAQYFFTRSYFRVSGGTRKKMWRSLILATDHRQRRRQMRWAIGVLLALVTIPVTIALFAQERPRILIITDLEGVGGINDRDEQILPGQRRFEESRRLLIGEVNAAVEGALKGGAREVVVWDGHDGSRTLSIDEIHPRAQLIQGRPTPADYYMSERQYDGIMFVGQHAMALAAGALAHSQSSATIERITLNGRPVGEIGQVAAIGGYFNVPTIMLSGDDAACREL